MKIGIDASRYNLGGGTGIELYSTKIIHGLIEYFKHHKEHSLVFYTPKKLALYKTKNIQHRVIPMKRFWTKIRLSIEMLLHKPDVLFVPSHMFPYFAPKNAYIMVHDLAFMHLKKAYSRIHYWHLKSGTKYAVKKAKKILVPSEATKKDLIKFFKCPEEKIELIYHGCDFAHKTLQPKFESKVFEQMGLKRKDNFFLFVGRIEAKKNIERIIEAFVEFSKNFPHWKLILAGKRGQGFQKILNQAERLNAFEKIIMPGYITENEKHVLMKYCNAFVFPSLYEGFGFPILEAFTYGKIVITSQKASAPEVAGDAAIYVDPSDAKSIQDAMRKIIPDSNLKTELVEKGKARLAKFKWKDSIAQTVKILIS